MYIRSGFPAIVMVMTLSIAGNGYAQADDPGERDELRITALEALMSAPPERALPAVRKVLAGEYSNEVKESALFILSQMESDEAQGLLLDFARDSDGELREEAITMIGISGDDDALAALRDLYASGDASVREAVLSAYLIAHETEIVYDIAVNAADVEEFETAVETLAAMGAIDELRMLKASGGNAEALAQAYAIAGDFETLRTMALDGGDPDAQVEAIGALGIIGSDAANETLMAMYRGSDDSDVREAALEGMLISGYDDGIAVLYRETDDVGEKQELLEYLSYMDSDMLWDIVDEALENRR
ncbi:MAG: HEAT repeat domain-containing protein [Gammaproteobacteria bacterium]|nr:HEAT repeat domain-containing protein [Gammaproteobacteria bacterium]MDH5344861.1 HEAT repeat domain-containing protein [Gammaproteobacteria bacterium]